MIQFKALIHKETGTAIKYEDWKEKLEDNEYIVINNYTHGPMEMILNDDFEIIYNSEFILEEIETIFYGKQNSNDKLMKKIHTNMYDKEFLKDKYGIEV
jgi:hypothetical protein